MRFSVSQIMQKIAATVNQEAEAPTTGGSEYELWLEYLNRGVQEWSEAHDWEAMRKNFFPAITANSTATVALPLDFKKLAAPVKVHKNTSTEDWTEYPSILDEQKGLYSSSDEYVQIKGDISSGMNTIFHPATLASGASVEITYFAMPTSLASPAQVPIVPDTQFLVDRTIAYVFEARSDARFQLMEQKARERLLGMIENANLAKFNSYDNPNYVMTSPERKLGFRLGRD